MNSLFHHTLRKCRRRPPLRSPRPQTQPTPPSLDLRSLGHIRAPLRRKPRGRTGSEGFIHGGGATLHRIEAFLAQDSGGGGGVIFGDPAFDAQRNVVGTTLNSISSSSFLCA
ncbi:jacalin lectin family protein [Striga asiatica]|uniref:Jacalin lectin family protein n=1 Tax=Striga asiatica TaxID=4170 RepID=A0A5A7PWQ2_STRAF|nr:jacalin lectin family protein [Striga asiatica]